MSESVRRNRGQRVVPALGFSLVVILIVAPDYWTYHVLSSHNVVVGVPILLVSYVAFSVAVWLLCVAARVLGLYRRGKPDNTQGIASVPRESADMLRSTVDQGCRRHSGTRRRGCTGRVPRRRQASA